MLLPRLRYLSKKTYQNYLSKSKAKSVQIGKVLANPKFADIYYGSNHGCFR